MNNLGEKILDHYEKYLGSFIGAIPYSDNKYQIQLLGFDRAVENSLLLATLGLSKYSENINNCCEVVMAVDKDYDDCAEVFMNAVFYAVSNRMNFGRGTLIEGANNIIKDFSQKHNKTAVYFTEQYILPDGFTTIEEKCKIYLGFFVSKDEADYIKRYGSEKFEDILEQNNVDVIEINRPSVI